MDLEVFPVGVAAADGMDRLASSLYLRSRSWPYCRLKAGSRPPSSRWPKSSPSYLASGPIVLLLQEAVAAAADERLMYSGRSSPGSPLFLGLFLLLLLLLLLLLRCCSLGICEVDFDLGFGLVLGPVAFAAETPVPLLLWSPEMLLLLLLLVSVARRVDRKGERERGALVNFVQFRGLWWTGKVKETRELMVERCVKM